MKKALDGSVGKAPLKKGLWEHLGLCLNFRRRSIRMMDMAFWLRFDQPFPSHYEKRSLFKATLADLFILQCWIHCIGWVTLWKIFPAINLQQWGFQLPLMTLEGSWFQTLATIGTHSEISTDQWCGLSVWTQENTCHFQVIFRSFLTWVVPQATWKSPSWPVRICRGQSWGAPPSDSSRRVGFSWHFWGC